MMILTTERNTTSSRVACVSTLCKVHSYTSLKDSQHSYGSPPQPERSELVWIRAYQCCACYDSAARGDGARNADDRRSLVGMHKDMGVEGIERVGLRA